MDLRQIHVLVYGIGNRLKWVIVQFLERCTVLGRERLRVCWVSFILCGKLGKLEHLKEE